MSKVDRYFLIVIAAHTLVIAVICYIEGLTYASYALVIISGIVVGMIIDYWPRGD